MDPLLGKTQDSGYKSIFSILLKRKIIYTQNYSNFTYARPKSSFSKTPLVLAGLAAVLLVLRPNEDMPRPLLELLKLFDGGLNLADEYLTLARRLEKYWLTEALLEYVPKDRGGVELPC